MRSKMTDHQARQLLDSVMHYVTPEIRRKVMVEVPSAYNAWCGRLAPLEWAPDGIGRQQSASNGVPGALYTLQETGALWCMSLDYPGGASVMWTAFTSEADAKREAQEHENGYQ